MSAEQLTGLQLAVRLLAEIGDERSDAAIDAVHDLADERVTLRRHAAEQAQRIADLIAESEDKIPEMQAALEERLTLDRANRLLAARITKLERAERTLIAAGYTDNGGELWKPPLGPSASPLLERIDELEAERDRIQSAHDNMARAWRADRDERDTLSGQMIMLESDMRLMTEERDELRARLDAAAGQEPVAEVRTWHKSSDQHADLIDWCDAIENLPDGDHRLYAAPVPAQAAPDFDLTLDEQASQYLHDMTEPAAAGEPATTVRLLLGNGHSGRGLYICSAEYQGEGAVLLAASPESAR